MLRLVSKYRKDFLPPLEHASGRWSCVKTTKHPQELLNDTYKHIAEQYEMKGNLKKAEHYYVEAPGASS